MDVLTINNSNFVDSIFNSYNEFYDYSNSNIAQVTFKLKYSVDSEAISKFVNYCHSGKNRDLLINIRDSDRHIIFKSLKIKNYEKTKISNSDYYMNFTMEYFNKNVISKEDVEYKKIIRLNKIGNLLKENL
jgi:hypothetical protein